MMLFGGRSKVERTRVQLRVKVAMADMAERTDRFLRGRPPSGYLLGDDGPQPNPAEAAAGQVAHRTEGYIFRSIAKIRTDEGIPSPSAHDPWA